MGPDDAHARFLVDHHFGHLATVASDGRPQNKPVGYRYNAKLGTIDITGLNIEASAKYRNVGLNPEVAFVIDDVTGEGPSGMRFVEVRGRAERVAPGQTPPADPGPHIIRIHPRRIVSWNIDPARPGLQTRDIARTPGRAGSTRPTLDADAAQRAQAAEAVAGFIQELQAGLDQHDAQLYNRHFAEDVVWGSPFGAVVDGYAQLHAIHARLLRAATGGPHSRYEVERVAAPAPDLAIAHVRRVALDGRGQPIPPTADVTGAFSEMALYVLVRRHGHWWLAAGQNTPIRAVVT